MKQIFKFSGFDAFDDYFEDDKKAICGELYYYFVKLVKNRKLNPWFLYQFVGSFISNDKIEVMSIWDRSGIERDDVFVNFYGEREYIKSV